MTHAHAAKWSGLSDQELADVAVALEADWELYTREEDRERIRALAESADAEMTRRGIQPPEDE